MPAADSDGVVQGRAGHLFLELPVDLPDDLTALFLIGLHRLLVEQGLQLLVAVSVIVADRIAGVVLVEVLVGIVDGRARHVHRHRETRSEEHTSELQSLMRISYADFCLQKKTTSKQHTTHLQSILRLYTPISRPTN